MKPPVIFIIVLLLCTALLPGEQQLKYNLTYLFRMDLEGRIFFIVKYCSFYEASASVNFTAGRTGNGPYEFYYDGIGRTGYVMATGGLTGTSLYFFTADYDREKSKRFREDKIITFKKNYPHYAGSIKKIRRRPMTILSKNSGAIRFKRDANGIHCGPEVNMELTDSRSYTYSNIYKIMGKSLKFYNHSFWPAGGPGELGGKTGSTWYSRPLDFSAVMTEAAKLSSEWAEKKVSFKQDRKFTLRYRVVSADERSMVIRGESYPNVRVWKKMRIRHVLRYVRLRVNDRVVLEDEIYLNFADKKGKGGDIRLKLAIR